MSDSQRSAANNAGADQPNAARRVEVTAADLPLHCPMPGKRIWDSHPRVFLPIADAANGEEICPYCGTRYHLVGAADEEEVG